MVSTNNSISLLSSELSELKYAFLTMKESNEKALFTLKKQNKELMDKIFSLEKSHEKQQEKLGVLERENKLLKEEFERNYKNISLVSIRKRKQLDQDYAEGKNDENNEELILDYSLSRSENKRTKMNAEDYDDSDSQLYYGESSFESLSDDILHYIVEFTGEKCYSSFGMINRRCKNVFDTHNIPKETSLHGYASLDLIMQRYLQKIQEGSTKGNDIDETMYDHRDSIIRGIVKYNRRDVLDWIIQLQDIVLTRGTCQSAAQFGRIDLLSTVFRKSNLQTQNDLRRIDVGLCFDAAEWAQIDTLKWLRKHGCEWNEDTFQVAYNNDDAVVMDWLLENGCPTSYQYVEMDSESDSGDGDESYI